MEFYAGSPLVLYVWIYLIHYVASYGRKDHYTKRLKGFSIFASYTPNVDKKYTCYQDQGNKTLDTVLEVGCTRIARYVTIFNDKMNDPVGVFLEICEVEIYGCPRHKYGEKCARCGMCKYECDITGRCDTQGCKEGYLPPFCKECDDGTFGYYCRGTCSGHCARKVPCNKANGTCPGGSADGWQNVDCNESRYETCIFIKS